MMVQNRDNNKSMNAGSRSLYLFESCSLASKVNSVIHPPTTIGLASYEKRSYMGDLLIGNGDLQLNDLVPGDSGAIEDWIPLTSEKEGVTWFVRVRVTLRFEIMKIVAKEERESLGIPSKSHVDKEAEE